VELPFSQSCENNKDPILAVLQRHLAADERRQPFRVLEIAGGTGQHAVHFTTHMPWLRWQSSDVPEQIETLNIRLRAAAQANLPLALPLDVTQQDWPVDSLDAVFTANSLHIMPASAVAEFFRRLNSVIKDGGHLCIYGPFKYEGNFTTPSNAQFDLWLKSRNPLSGIRDFEWVNELASEAGLTLLEDNAMPANNQLLVWRK
jgi:SAM-dependent methyltransferase